MWRTDYPARCSESEARLEPGAEFHGGSTERTSEVPGELVRAHVQIMIGWRAASALGSADIVRQSFSCCGTSGSAEIWDELEAVRAAGGPVSGHEFFHMQDTDQRSMAA